jgi:hypothetical protein
MESSGISERNQNENGQASQQKEVKIIRRRKIRVNGEEGIPVRISRSWTGLFDNGQAETEQMRVNTPITTVFPTVLASSI